MHRNYVAADDLLLDSFQLARNIFESGFKPDFLVGLWRGGSAGPSTDQKSIRLWYGAWHSNLTATEENPWYRR